jgi:hypothetical protein
VKISAARDQSLFSALPHDLLEILVAKAPPLRIAEGQMLFAAGLRAVVSGWGEKSMFQQVRSHRPCLCSDEGRDLATNRAF